MPGLFRTQLRAAFRAAVNGNLWIMFPMVNSIEDIRKAKAFCRDVCDELEREGTAYRRDVPIGIMIETPSIALMAEEAAEECDFCSIGSNDLCQYTMAVDRMSPIVRPYYMSYHPSVLRLISMIIKAFAARGKTVGICGELGGDPKIVPVLIGMGMEKLSMNPSAVASVKSAICNLDSHKARQLAEKALSCTTEEEVKALL
ncbi:MAG: putative PEP-binding protein [Oscillospiraceae bacterium]